MEREGRLDLRVVKETMDSMAYRGHQVLQAYQGQRAGQESQAPQEARGLWGLRC